MVKKTISHYKLVKELGRGGMATVYEALDLVDQKRVALKVLLSQFSSDEIVRKRFLREAKAGMELDHPRIVKVYEVGEAKNEPFIAMELVKGKTLDEMIREVVLDVGMIIDIGLKVADALAVAHEKGIIHRDIKPRNIMVSNGGIKVMDFGLAKILETSTLTGPHEIVGTLHYMSPQQAIGSQIDGRSDIFSLGVVLYKLLTGSLPFEGDHPGAIIHSVLHSDPLRIEELREGIPREVEQVVFKALQKRPQERYQSAAEFKSDLESVKEILKGKTLELIATEEVFEERVGGIYSALVGRDRELEILEVHLERMLKGEGSTVLVRGEAGIGKSRLIWELGRKVKGKKVRYLIGRCLFGREGFPYQPILEIIRSYLELKGVKDPERLSHFIEKKAPHLTHRMEVIQAFLLIKQGKESPLINKEQLWDTATELVKVMSQDRPIMLHLDDLHSADLPTLNLLTYLSRNTRGERLLIVGTYRPEELIEEPELHPLSVTMERMRKEGLYEEISLGRLDEKSTQSVIRSVFPGSDFPESFTRSIYDDTEGNPLFILEVLKLFRNEGVISQEDEGWKLSGEVGKAAVPHKVNEVIMNRLRSLNTEERNLVDVASVEGRSFQSDTLCHCLRLPRMRVLLSLQDLEHSHHLIHASEREYYFDHGKIREVVYDNLIPELKREYHRLMGEYFKKNYREEEEYAGKITHHLLEANEEKQALPYLIKAGGHARKLFANEEAIGYFNKGIELVEKELKQHPSSDLRRTKLTLLKGRAEVRKLIGCYDDAEKDYEGIGKLAQGLEDQKEIAYGLTEIGGTCRRKGDYEFALSYLDQALRIQRQIGDRQGEGSTLRNIGAVHSNRSDYAVALNYYEQALKIQRQIGDKQGEGSTLSNIGGVHWDRGNYELSLNYYEQALKIQRRIGDKQGEGSTFNSIGNVHWSRGDYELSLSCYERALMIQRQIGDKRREGSTLNNIGGVHGNRGDYELSLSYYEQALRIQRQIGDRRGEGTILNNIGVVHRNRGDYTVALDYYEQALGIRRQIGDRRGEDSTLNNIGIVHGKRGDWELALKYYEQALKIGRQIGDREREDDILNNIGLLHWSQGDYKLALSHYGQALKIGKQIGDKWSQWESYHYLCELWLDLGDPEKALENLGEAAEIAEAIGTRRMSAWFQIHSGMAKFLRGYYEDALVDIQKGLRIARETQEIDAILEGLVVAVRLEIARRNHIKASQYAEEALSVAMDKGMKPDSAHAHLLLARIHLSEGNLHEVESHASQARKTAEGCEMKKWLWQSYHCLGKVFLKRKRHSLAIQELKKAAQTVDDIASELSKELRIRYLSQPEIEELHKDIRRARGK